MTNETVIKAQIYLPKAIYELLKERSKATGSSIALQIRQALAESIKEETASNPLLKFSRKFAKKRSKSFRKNIDEVVYNDTYVP
ncbi:MAG: hypothetical protein AAB443_02710 [Patescibacteria group bacterium]